MTNENITPEVKVENTENKPGCLGQLGWFFSGAVLPIGSFSFYRKAVQKSVGSAILFFVVFTIVISTLATIKVAVDIFSVIGSIQQAYADGKIPAVTISNGVAEVSGPQPAILLDGEDTNGQRTFVAIDTTGKIKQINDSKYNQGFLLTRDSLHILNQQNGYQVLPLSQLQSLLERDPIIINAQTVSTAWGIMSSILVILAFIFLVFWHTVVRLMVISMIALIIWGIVALIRPNTGFGPIIITGLYAIVPAIYLSHLISRSGITFPGVQTFLLLIFWITGLVVNFANIKFFIDERPMHLWTALIGVPMLIFFYVDIFWPFTAPYDVIALWVLSLLTGFILIGVRLFYRYKDQKTV
jgi:hypothetical protein